MDPQNDDLPGEDEQDPPAEPTTGPDTSLSSEQVRNSPEYRALQAQHRTLARQKGTAERQLAEARADAERAQQTAIASQTAAQQAEIEAILGPDGVEAWNQIAELSANDPVAAARRLAEVRAQQPAAAPATGGETVTQPQAPATPPPPRSIDAGAPLATVASRTEEERIAQLGQTFSDVVKANQEAANRVTMKDRARGGIAYLEAAYRQKRLNPEK